MRPSLCVISVIYLGGLEDGWVWCRRASQKRISQTNSHFARSEDGINSFHFASCGLFSKFGRSVQNEKNVLRHSLSPSLEVNSRHSCYNATLLYFEYICYHQQLCPGPDLMKLLAFGKVTTWFCQPNPNR